MTTIHCFEIEDAKKYGVAAATILYNIRFWLDKNKANKKHIQDGRVWTYNSVAAFSELFPYLTEKQIRSRLKKLVDEGVLLTANYNSSAYDRTLWYSVNEPDYSILPNGKIDLPIRANGSTEKGEPIPDINTDINTDGANLVRNQRLKSKITPYEVDGPKLELSRQEVEQVAMKTGRSIVEVQRAAKKCLAYNAGLGRKVVNPTYLVISWLMGDKEPEKQKKIKDL